MRKRAHWLLALGVTLLAGCEPAEVAIDLRSPRRVDETVVALVPAADISWVEPMLLRCLPGEWKVRRASAGDGLERLALTRRVDPRVEPALSVERTVIGPFRLRYEYDLTYEVAFPDLPARHPARALAEDLTATVRVRVPGRIAGETNAGSNTADTATWVLELSELVAEPKVIQVRSRAWRGWLLLAWLIIIGLIVWVFWPWLVPPEEVARQRAARREEKRRAAAERKAARAKKRQEAAERKAERRRAAAERKQARQAAAEPEEAPAEATEEAAEPAPEAEPADAGAEPTDEAGPASALGPSPGGRASGLRSRRAVMRRRRTRRFVRRR